MSASSFNIPQNPKTTRADVVALIRHTMSILAQPGDTVELRIPGIQGKRTDSGYFNDFEKLAQCAAGYDGRAEGIYITVNPVQPALLARSNNRVKEYAKQTTADKDVARRRWIFIDFDPVRPAGISSSDDESAKALEKAITCREKLTQRGIPSLLANSGNGAHLLIPVDLPNDAESTALVKDFLVMLDYKFSDEYVKIDTGMIGASHLIKLYGTLACKGDSIPERPHRRSVILDVPESLEPVEIAVLQKLIASVPLPDSTSAKPATTHVHTSTANRNDMDTVRERFDLIAYAERMLGVQAIQQGNEFRLPGNGGFLVNPTKGTWYHHTGQQGGDALDLVGHGLFGASWSRRDAEMFRTALEKAAQFAGVTLTAPTRVKTVPVETSPALTDAQPAAPTTAQRPKKSAADLLMHIDDLDNLPPIRWLINDYLPEDSLVEIYGAPSAGKTQVAFDMAQTLAATGKTVIYVVAEGLRGYRNRKKAWQQFRKQSGGDLFIWREPVQLFETQAVQQFIDAIKSKQPVLVVFDTLSRCSLGADENNQKDMGFILESLDYVRRETGATVLAVHHTNAAGGRERGSTVIRGGMDVMMEVSKEDDLIAVACAKVKDSGEFDTALFKPVLVDIGEEAPVPVLIPAERRIQTQADKLSTLQLEILRAIGMEMFAKSGIKSNQLDEILPPGTKRASKYYSLNSLIRLGYVEPHEKGDPYKITDEGRLKLSNAETAAASVKSNVSKESLSPFIWTLPESCPMSSPVPHTYGCGTDETLDNMSDGQTNNSNVLDETALPDVQSEVIGQAAIERPTSENPQAEPVDNVNSVPQMTELDISRYAAQAGVRYPTSDGATLYQIAEIVPPHLRNAFASGLGDALTAYRAEAEIRGQEPSVKPIRDILALYLKMGFVSTVELFEGYQHAREMGHKAEFLQALRTRNEKAVGYLRAMVAGERVRENVVIQTLPCNTSASASTPDAGT